MDHPGHGHFRAGFAEFVGLERREGTIRHGARRHFLSHCRRDSSEVPDASARVDLSGNSGELDGAYRKFRRVEQSVYFCGVDLLWAGCSGIVSDAQHRAGDAAPLQMLGLSVGSGIIRGRGAGVNVEYLAGAARALECRAPADYCGYSFLSVVEEIGSGKERWKISSARSEHRAQRSSAAPYKYG